MAMITAEYSDITLYAMHKRALRDARRDYGNVLDKGWQISVGTNWTSLRSYFEVGGKVEMYTTAL